MLDFVQVDKGGEGRLVRLAAARVVHFGRDDGGGTANLMRHHAHEVRPRIRMKLSRG